MAQEPGATDLAEPGHDPRQRQRQRARRPHGLQRRDDGQRGPGRHTRVYVTVVAASGLLALVGTALPGRMALKARPVTVATARE